MLQAGDADQVVDACWRMVAEDVLAKCAGRDSRDLAHLARRHMVL